MRGRPRLPGGRILVAVAAVGLTVALAQHPVHSAFTAVGGSTGNTVGAAASFCTTPDSSTVVAEADSFIDQANQPATSGGAATFLVVTPQAGAVRRTLVRFAMPPIPPGCEVTSATLRIFAESQTAGRTLGAYQANPNVAQWTEATLNWSNRPGTVGDPATAVMPNGDQYVQWSVAAIVRAIYAGPTNNGFVIRDVDETGPGAWQQFASRSVATDKPLLDVAWG